jgi:hypothetical protein
MKQKVFLNNTDQPVYWHGRLIKKGEEWKHCYDVDSGFDNWVALHAPSSEEKKGKTRKKKVSEEEKQNKQINEVN